MLKYILHGNSCDFVRVHHFLTDISPFLFLKELFALSLQENNKCVTNSINTDSVKSKFPSERRLCDRENYLKLIFLFTPVLILLWHVLKSPLWKKLWLKLWCFWHGTWKRAWRSVMSSYWMFGLHDGKSKQNIILWLCFPLLMFQVVFTCKRNVLSLATVLWFCCNNQSLLFYIYTSLSHDRTTSQIL